MQGYLEMEKQALNERLQPFDLFSFYTASIL